MKFQFSNILYDDFAIEAKPVAGKTLSDVDAMRECLRIAWGGLPHVQPNPLVGACAIDSDGKFLASAAHEKYGQEHAEKNLIKKIDELGPGKLNNATLFVSLEPCCHQGKTPPCTDAILKTGIRKVIYLTLDPNPLVSGNGHQQLLNAGIETHQLIAPELSKIFDYQNRIYISQIQKKKSVFIGLKAAATLNGQTAIKGDSRNWITCERSRSYAHFLRLQYDAIATGATTVIADNPTLNSRDSKLAGTCTVRIIFDPDWKALMHRKLRDQKLLSVHPEKVIWIGHKETVTSKITSRINELGKLSSKVFLSEERHVDYSEISQILKNDSLNSMLVEGGAGLYDSTLLNFKPEFIHYFIAPKIWLHGSALAIGTSGASLNEIEMINPVVTQLDQDLLIESHLNSRA